jgi:hypothetical protein
MNAVKYRESLHGNVVNSLLLQFFKHEVVMAFYRVVYIGAGVIAWQMTELDVIMTLLPFPNLSILDLYLIQEFLLIVVLPEFVLWEVKLNPGNFLVLKVVGR